jgi:hypothetical protein
MVAGRVQRFSRECNWQQPASWLALAIGVRKLAGAAEIVPRTLHRLDTGGMIHVSE